MPRYFALFLRGPVHIVKLNTLVDDAFSVMLVLPRPVLLLFSLPTHKTSRMLHLFSSPSMFQLSGLLAFAHSMHSFFLSAMFLTSYQLGCKFYDLKEGQRKTRTIPFVIDIRLCEHGPLILASRASKLSISSGESRIARRLC